MHACCHAPRYPEITYTSTQGMKNWPFLSQLLQSAACLSARSVPESSHPLSADSLHQYKSAEETQGPGSCSFPGRHHLGSVRRQTPTTTTKTCLAIWHPENRRNIACGKLKPNSITADLLNPGPPGSLGRAGAA